MQTIKPFEHPKPLLTDLILIVHAHETENDRQAKHYLEECLDQLGRDEGYSVEKAGWDSEEYPLPYLRYSRSCAYGLDQVIAVVDRERALFLDT
jgi:hypothetical protein